MTECSIFHGIGQHDKLQVGAKVGFDFRRVTIDGGILADQLLVGIGPLVGGGGDLNCSIFITSFSIMVGWISYLSNGTWSFEMIEN